jgi:ribosomal protein S18 acetylase RimI-like enzyme
MSWQISVSGLTYAGQAERISRSNTPGMLNFQQLSNWWQNLTSPQGLLSVVVKKSAPEPLSTYWMSRTHMPGVLALESALPRPWAEQDFVDALRVKNIIGKVITTSSGMCVVGHAVFELHKHSCEVLRIVVDPEFSESAAPRKLIAPMEQSLRWRFKEIAALVDEYDLTTQNLLKAIGFTASGIVRNGYQSIFEVNDALVFTLSCQAKPSPSD